MVRIAFLLMMCVCGFAAAARAQLVPRVYASGFTLPVAFVQDPLDPAVQFVVQQDGHIRAVRSGVVQSADFLDLSSQTSASGERGLLGLAFPPDAGQTQRFFVNFTNLQGNTVVARFKRSSNPLVADPSTRFDLKWGVSRAHVIVQPYSNHNGGHLAFGPDGYLYIGMGDGGSANDPENRAQDPNELLGKMLRIDVSVPDSDPTGYRVPSDNPFVDASPVAALYEIWSFGLRNPWRFSFDDPARGGTGALVIGDVGQGSWEEVDYEPAGTGGRNYGWRYREGNHPNVTSVPPAYQPLFDPAFEYGHDVGASITGGYVYRGQALGAGFAGRYFFADFVRGRVWSMTFTTLSNGVTAGTNLMEHTAELGGSSLGNISSFGIDSTGELYLVGYSTGRIIAILGQPPRPPTNLRILP